MRPATLAIAFLAIVGSALATPPPPPTPSRGPSNCSYTCPDKDVSNYAKHAPSCGEENDNLVCSYKQNGRGFFGNNDYTCRYNKNTGRRIQDRNNGNCPDMAQQTCTNGPRYLHEDNFTASKRNAEKRAADPQPVAVPAALKSRRALRKNRHHGLH